VTAPAHLAAVARPERDFHSDNCSGVAPVALTAVATIAGRAASYGDDAHTEAATAAVGSLLAGAKCTWVPTGTAANLAALGALLGGPGSAVLCAADAHVRLDEAGAVERAWGVPLIPVPTSQNLLAPQELLAVCDALAANVPFSPTPAVLVVSLPSERGACYTRHELGELVTAARSRGLAVHVDGARFANALAADASLHDILDIVDTLALGGTKNGQGTVEAVVTASASLDARAKRAAKQLGYTASKMRFWTSGIAASIRSGEYLSLATSANATAAALAAGLADLGVTVDPPGANLVFARFTPNQADALAGWCGASVWDAEGLVRFACSWDHTPADVAQLLLGVAALLGIPGPLAIPEPLG
jgi:threonine aldolase